MFEPTKIDMLTAIAEGNASQQSISAVRALTVRLPVHVYAGVDALAKLSSTTKGAMVSSLVEAALEQVVNNLSPERRSEFLNLQGDALQHFAQYDAEVENEETTMGKAR